MLGDRKSYFIKPNYTIRTEFKHFDDTPFKDEWQDGVYSFARGLLEFYKFRSVCDIGCGSGFKLLKYFAKDSLTLGVDVPQTVEWLQQMYPGKMWRSVPLDGQVDNFDFAICSDVIEHLVDPDTLLEFISRSSFKRVVISTPERDVLKLGTENGPPRNLHHIREWNSEEFKAYVSSYFQIVHHQVIGQTQFVEVVI